MDHLNFLNSYKCLKLNKYALIVFHIQNFETLEDVIYETDKAIHFSASEIGRRMHLHVEYSHKI